MPLSISIQSNIHAYEVTFEESAEFLRELATQPRACFVVDENVWNIYRDTNLSEFPAGEVIVLPAREDRKNLDTVQELFDQLVGRTAKRNLTLISCGGGIVQDVTGFTASTIYRGVHWIYVPTTLLAQADSCIGSKTSLNYKKYKNLVGTFYPPFHIHIYPGFLASQSESDFRSGFGEVIKLHLMGGEESFHQLRREAAAILTREAGALREAIRRSLNIKLSYMAGDEFDQGRRNLLNYGHDFGHALESTSDFAVPHGQAVIFGMLAANLIARGRGILTEQIEQDISESLLLPNLVVRPSLDALDPTAMVNAMKQDKKRINEDLALIMLTSQFDLLRVNDLTAVEVTAVLETLRKLLHSVSTTGIL